MQFEPNHIYHIYNRGNKSDLIFFNRENYIFFLRKIKTFISPFSDILAWCLMPNHFHILVYLNVLEIELQADENLLSGKRSFNDSIGIMLRTYTRAIQKQEKFSGSLFQKNTKSICLTGINGLTPAWFQSKYGTVINVIDPEKEYPKVCFNYIHENPVNARLVKKAEEWEFCSFRDYYGNRKGKLVSRERAIEFGLV